MNKDDCKCERDCVCVEAMYLIVHVSKKSSPKLQHKVPHIDRAPSPVIFRVNEKGQEEFLQKVYTDLSGKPLSDEETKRRIEERESREQRDQELKKEIKTERSFKSPSSLDILSYHQVTSPLPPDFQQIHQPSVSILSPTPTQPMTSFDNPASMWPETLAPSCCQHATNASQTPFVMTVFPSQSLPPIGVAAAGCNCGSGCQCIHCPEHANNAATRQYNQQQLSHMANNSYLPSDFQISGPLFRPEVPQASCMGGPTTFRLSSRPPQPTELSRMFPDAKPGSYVMHYEVKRNPQNGLHYVNQMDDTGFYSISDDVANDVAFSSMNIDQNIGDLQHEFDTFMGDESIGWDNVTIGDANVSQIPAALSHQHRVDYSSGMLGSNIAVQPDLPPSFPHRESGSVNPFDDIDMSTFVVPLASNQLGSVVDVGNLPSVRISEQPVRERPNVSVGEPWMQDFTIDGPFMGHPASPLPTSSSPIPMGAF